MTYHVLPYRLPALAAGLLLCLLSAGCQSDNNEPAESVPVIHNAGRGVWPAGREWHLVEEARIGSVSDDGPAVFGTVVDIALDGYGRVWIADGMQQDIRVFEPNGKHVRTIGRKGGGPTEFARIAGMDFSPAGQLWILDAGNARFVVYDTAGSLVGTHPRNATLSVTPWPGGFDSKGNLYDVAAFSGGVTAEAVVRLDSAMQAADTFRLPAFKGAFFESSTGDARNRTVRQVNVPFTGQQIWRVDPHGSVWVAVTDEYRFERRSFDGSVERIVEREYTPLRVSRQERQRILESYESFVRQGGKIDENRIPDHHPPLLAFFFDDRDHLWSIPTYLPVRNPSFDVFDSRGTYLGTVQVPVRVLSRPSPVVRGNRMIGVIRDETDVQSVVVLRIEKPDT